MPSRLTAKYLKKARFGYSAIVVKQEFFVINRYLDPDEFLENIDPVIL